MTWVKVIWGCLERLATEFVTTKGERRKNDDKGRSRTRVGAGRRGSGGREKEDTQGNSVTLPGGVVLKNPIIGSLCKSLS